MGFVRSTCALGLCLVALANVAIAQSMALSEVVAALPQCAIDCLGPALLGSGCNATDVACLCASEALNVQGADCVFATCEVKEALSTKNITSVLCGLPVENEEEFVPVLSVFIGLAGLAVLLRLLARVVTKAYFWWDDLFNIIAMGGCIAYTALNIQSAQIGLGKDIWFVEFPHVTEVVQKFFVNMLLYTATRFLVRSSIILFYLRVFPPGPDNKLGHILIMTLVANVVYNLSFFFAVIFQCSPIDTFWVGWEDPDHGHCGNVNILAWVAAVTGILFDVWLLALPFPQLWALNLHWKKKIMGAMMFSVGICVMIISLVRLKTINEFTRAVNPTKDIVQVCLWSGLELDVGVICPCLPSFRLLLRRLLPKIMGTTSNSRYEMGTVTGAGTNEQTGTRTSKTASAVPKEMAGVAGDKISQDEEGSHADARSFCASSTGLVESDLKRDGRDAP